MWSWHHKRYLGAAHGVAGILHVLLMCPVEMIEPYISDILQTIEWLTTYQDNDGNWPTSLKQRYTQPNDLVQYRSWCHGASGMLILFTTLIRRAVAHPEVFPLSTAFLTSLATAIQRAASLVYQKGLLCKGVGLCHGVAGSVYALLAASDAMGLWKHYEHSKVHFLRAIHLAHLATSYSQLTLAGEMTSPDKPWSLYGGVAGMCCAWAEVYDRLGTTGRNLDRLEFSWCRLRIYPLDSIKATFGLLVKREKFEEPLSSCFSTRVRTAQSSLSVQPVQSLEIREIVHPTSSLSSMT
ncbi:hypothetical protein F5879DRAFT_974483 [Lentinula edodes]|nr:hypothetical protein F5879DRAFT_974483 [Lentinula edodes]